MKKTKILLIILALLMVVVTAVVFTNVKQIAVLGDEGYAVAGSAQVKQSLAKGYGEEKKMVKVNRDDIVYSSVLGYFVGTEKTAIDKTYPVFANNGITVRFLNDENWLVSDEVNLLQTYEGLYLNDGYTFNQDNSQADLDEFILLALNNGLYMNAQPAVFTNRLHSTPIPVNSICQFTDTSLRWYSYKPGGFLTYGGEESVYEATIQIGDHVYDYMDFLDALGLIEKAIEKKEKGQDAEEEQQQALAALEHEKEPKPSQVIVEDLIKPTNPAEPETSSNTDLPGSEDFSIAELEENVTGERDISDDFVEFVPSEGGDVTDTTEKEVKTGQDIPDTDRSKGKRGESGRASDYYEEPSISLGGFEAWYYAVGASLSYTDNVAAMETNVQVTAYKNIHYAGEGKAPAPKKDGAGHDIYDGTAYVGDDMVFSRAFSKSENFAIAPLEPGTSVYIQYFYTYRTRAGEKVDYRSVITKIDLPAFDPEGIAGIKGTWAGADKEYEEKFGLNSMTFENTTDYKESTTFSFEEFKKNTLAYFNNFVLTLDKVGGTDHVVIEDNHSAAERAKKAKYNFVSNNVLQSDSTYKYTVYGLDKYGNVMPLVISIDGGQTYVDYTKFSSTVHTIAKVPYYEEPKVFVGHYDPWVYAVGVHLDYSDPAQAMLDAVKVSAYSNIIFEGDDPSKAKPYTDDEGNVVYPSSADGNGYTGVDPLYSRTFAGTQDFAIGTIKPGSTIYVQYTYSYYTDATHTIQKTVTSGLTQITLQEYMEGRVTAVNGVWSVPYAAYPRKFAFEDMKLTNASDYGGNTGDDFDFEEYKKNTLQFVKSINVSLVNQQDSKKTVETTVGSAYVEKAKRAVANYYSGNILEKKSSYDYTLYAVDAYGNKIPFNVSVDGGVNYTSYKTFKGTVTTNDKGGGARDYKEPVISMHSYDKWCYAVAEELSYYDPASTITTGILVQVTDEKGATLYNRKIAGSQKFAIGPFRPGSTIYVQYRYSYYDDGTYTTQTEYVSPKEKIVLQTIEEAGLYAVKGTWLNPYAEYSNKGLFADFVLENTSDYSDSKVFDFNDYKKDTLKYLSNVVLTVTDVDGKKSTFTTRLGESNVALAKQNPKNVATAAVLEPASVYTYTIAAVDQFNNELPFRVSDDKGTTIADYKDFVGHLYTRKASPKITVKYGDITKDTVFALVELHDDNEQMHIQDPMVLEITDSKGTPVMFSAVRNGETYAGVYSLDLTMDVRQQLYSYDIKFFDLEPFKDYRLTIRGVYDAEPHTQTGHQTMLIDEVMFTQVFSTARNVGEYGSPTVVLDEVAAKDAQTVTGKIKITDEKKVVTGGIVVTVFDNVTRREEPLQDVVDATADIFGAGSCERYSWREYAGAHMIRKSSVWGDGAVSVTDLIPSGKAYVQLSFNYLYVDGNGVQKRKGAYSDLIEIQMPYAEFSFDTLKIAWDEVFAAAAKGYSLEHIRANTINDGTLKVDTLTSILDHVDMTLMAVDGTGVPITVSVGADTLVPALRAQQTFSSGQKDLIMADTVYKYTVKAYRVNGGEPEELAMQISADGADYVSSDDFSGILYTRKTTPQAHLKASANAYGSITLDTYIEDPNGAMMTDRPITFSLKDEDGQKIVLTGTLDGVAIPDNTSELIIPDSESHRIRLRGLTVNKWYEASLIGSYDPQPSARETDTEGRLEKVLDTELLIQSQRKFRTQQGQNPEVDMYGLEPWSYAIRGSIEVTDPSGSITADGVVVTAYDSTGKRILIQNFTGTQEFILYPFEPGTTAYLQYSYDYLDAATGAQIHVESDMMSVDLLSIDEANLSPVIASWNERFAVSSSQMSLTDIYFANTSDYVESDETNDFENFKKNSLLYINSIDVRLTPVGAGDEVYLTIGSDIVQRGKKSIEEWIDRTVTSKRGLLMSNTEYMYRVTAKDKYGNVVPMIISADGREPVDQSKFSGTIYTQKEKPEVMIEEEKNNIGDMRLRVTIVDKDESLVPGAFLKFYISDKDGKITPDGTIDEVPFEFGVQDLYLKGKDKYVIMIDNLELGFNYLATVEGTYDPQPDRMPREDGKDLDIIEDAKFTTYKFVATDGSIALPGTGGGQGTDPGKLDDGSYVAYIQPEVNMRPMTPWAYAIGTGLDIIDTTSSIARGVSVTVYKGISGNGRYTWNEQGQRVYAAKNEQGATVNTGINPLLRYGTSASGDFALGTLPPGTKVYVQASASYTEIITEINTDPVTRKKTVTTKASNKKTLVTDLTEIQLYTVDEAIALNDLEPVGASWNEEFATYPHSFSMRGMQFLNISGYDPEPEEFSFDNYKKNTLSYLNNVSLILTDRKTGAKSETKISSANVQKAIVTSGGIMFKATTDELASNRVYDYVVKAYDKYNNPIPTSIRSGDSHSYVPDATFVGQIYTRKDIPKVTITETGNVSGTMSFKVKVTDTDHSLKDTDQLKFYLTDSRTRTKTVFLGGTVDGEPIEDGAEYLLLSPTSEHSITLDSLEFNASYAAVVEGTYYPQPDDTPEGKSLDPVEHTQFSVLVFTTAELSSGSIWFEVKAEDTEILDTSAHLTVQMSADSTEAVLDVLTHFTFTLKDDSTGIIMDTIELSRDELYEVPVTAGEEVDYLIPRESGIAEVRIKGLPRDTDNNLWNALLLTNGQPPALTIDITFPESTLKSKTTYLISMTSEIRRANGEPRLVRTTPSLTSFTTKKTDPVLRYDDFFVAAARAQLSNPRVFDPDSTLSGRAVLYLYDVTDTEKEAILLSTQYLSIIKDPGSTQVFEDVIFDHLTEGNEYNVVVRGLSYNNRVSGGTYGTKTIWDETFTAGGNLYGTISLDSLSYDYKVNGKQQWLNFTGDEIYEFIHTDGAWNPEEYNAIGSWTNYGSPYFGMDPDEVAAFTLESMLSPTTNNQWPYIDVIYYYKNNKGNMTSLGGNPCQQRTYRGGDTFILPAQNSASIDGLIYVRLTYVRNQAMDKTDGFDVTGFRTSTYAKKTRITADMSADPDYQGSSSNLYIDTTTGKPYEYSGRSAVYLVPTTPGSSYVMRAFESSYAGNGGTECHIFWYDKNKKMISYELIKSKINYVITAPDKAAYLSYDVATGTLNTNISLFRLNSAAGGNTNKFSATNHVFIMDENGYLDKTAGGQARIKLYESDSVREPDFVVLPEKQTSVQLVKKQKEDGTTYWTYDGYLDFDGLKPDKLYRACISIDFKSSSGTVSEVELATTQFQTDGEYELIWNEHDIDKMYRNPYGNFLIAADFTLHYEWDFTFHGVLEGEGHTITQIGNQFLLGTLGSAGVVRNIVFEVQGNTYDTRRAGRPLVYNNYGLMENIVVRTTGEFWKTPANYYYELMCCYNYGIIRNFIVEFGGDYHVCRDPAGTNYAYSTIFVYANYGSIEHGYIYGKDNAKLYIGQPEDGEHIFGYVQAGLIRYQEGTVNDVFMKFDTYQYTPTKTGTTTYRHFWNDAMMDTITNYYYSGDFYQIDATSSEPNPAPTLSTEDRMFNNASNGVFNNIWHVTDAKYSTKTERTSYIKRSTLKNDQWQHNILENAHFEIDQNLGLGYYPRLRLNDLMEPYQRYIPLPETTSEVVPQFIGTDTAGPDYQQGENYGTIKVMFDNPFNTRIESISINKLTVKQIRAGQGKDENGIYNVFLDVEVDESKGDEYLSEYQMIEFSYKGGGVPVALTAKTQGFAFWKGISTTDDWKGINTHLNWNYRLLNDIDFGNIKPEVAAAQIQILNTKTNFTGKIDGTNPSGGCWALQNITLENQMYPSVIYRMNHAQLSNLIIDNLNLSGFRIPTDTYAGFVAYATYSTFDNVSVQNSTITGIGQVGGLVGGVESYSAIQNCSVIDTKIRDLKTDTASYFGGLVGITTSSNIRSCFVRDIDIFMDLCTNPKGIGGLVGRPHGTAIVDCYVTGKITGNAWYIGGAIGSYSANTASFVDSIWTDVTIDVIGDYVGGFAGRAYCFGKGVLAVGDIYCVGEFVKRNNAYSAYSNFLEHSAYEAQAVTGLTTSMKDDAKYLISGEDLLKWYVWTDKIRLDENWYLEEQVKAGMYPQVYTYPAQYDALGNRVLVPNQMGLYLPGQSGEQQLIVNQADYYQDAGRDVYHVEAELVHPGMTHEQFVEQYNAYKDAGRETEIINIDGMDMDQTYHCHISLTDITLSGSDKYTTQIVIDNGDKDAAVSYDPYTKALDVYRFTVSYVNGTTHPSMMADLTYRDVNGNPIRNYWEIPDLPTWYDRIGVHGKNNENFKITALIGFNGGFGYIPGQGRFTEADYRNLRINHLVGASGDITGEGRCGFTNFHYTCDVEGDPWIAQVDGLFKDLVFEDFTGTLINDDMTKDRTRSATIFTIRYIDHCAFRNVKTEVSVRTMACSGMFMIAYNDVTNCLFDGIYYDGANVTTAKNYAGGIAAFVQGSVTNCTGSGFCFNAPLASYAGGLFSCVNASTQITQSPIAETFFTNNKFYGGRVNDGGVMKDGYVRGDNYVGYVTSHIYAVFQNNTLGTYATDTATNTFSAIADTYAGGFGYYLSPSNNNSINDNTVINGVVRTVVSAASSAGGMFGNVIYNTYRNEAIDMVVSAYGTVGGLYGSYNYYNYNSYVVGCTVESLSDNGRYGSYTSIAGGLIGAQTNNGAYGCVVRDTTVKGSRNVGGLFGSQGNACAIYYDYVAEDVTVTATDPETSNAGGVVGSGTAPYIQYTACGATVLAAGNNAGGMIGRLGQNLSYVPNMISSYFMGKVTGADFVGGLIGFNANYVYHQETEAAVKVDHYDPVWFHESGNATAKDWPNRDKMLGVVVGGSINSMGPHVSLWYNNDPQTDAFANNDNPRLLLWDKSVINGAPPAAATLPPKSFWETASDLREIGIYKNAARGNFGTTYYDYEFEGVLETYAPYVKYNGVILKYSNFRSYEEQEDGTLVGVGQVGIKLPDYTTNPDSTVAYASGINTVNFEVTKHTPVDPKVHTYQQVEYIKSDGKCYIDTGYTGSDNDIAIECKFDDPNSSGNYLFGQEQIGNMAYNALYNQNALEYNWKTVNYTKSTTIEMIQTINGSNIDINFNGTTVTKPIGTNKSTHSLLIFACWNSSLGLRYYPTTLTCYYFNVKIGDTYIRKFIPVMRDDGLIGLYDTLAKRMYENEGTGTFTAGPAVGEPFTVDPSASLTAGSSSGGEVNARTAAKLSVQFGSGTPQIYETDADGVLTLTYNFDEDITVTQVDENGAAISAPITYKPEDFRRQVAMTALDKTGMSEDDKSHTHNMWYYIGEYEDAQHEKHDNGLCYGTNVTGQSAVPYVIPSEYTQVEYIQATGGQYFKTGIKGNAVSEYDIEFTSSNTERHLMGYGGSSDEYWGVKNGKFEDGGTVSSIPSNDGRHYVRWDYHLTSTSKNTLYVDDEVAVSKNSSKNVDSLELQIFAIGGSYLCKAKLYEAKIFKDLESEEPVRWFIPVKRNSDEKVGLWDVIREEFILPAKGTVTCGDPFDPGLVIKDIPYTGTVTGLPANAVPIHMWDTVNNGTAETQVLVRIGTGTSATYKYYRMGTNVSKLADGTWQTSVVANTGGDVTSGTKQSSKPFWQTTITASIGDISANTGLKVFHNFSILQAPTSGGVTPAPAYVDYRMYTDGNLKMTMLPDQGLVYDKVIVDQRASEEGLITNYQAVFGKNGTLTNNFGLTKMNLFGIDEISNSFFSEDPYIVVQYENGALQVWNYETGKIMFKIKEGAGFIDYVRNTLSTMFRNLTGTNTASGTNGESGNAKKLLTGTVMKIPGATITSGYKGTRTDDASYEGKSESAEGTGEGGGKAEGSDNELKVKNSAAKTEGGVDAGVDGVAATGDGNADGLKSAQATTGGITAEGTGTAGEGQITGETGSGEPTGEVTAESAVSAEGMEGVSVPEGIISTEEGSNLVSGEGEGGTGSEELTGKIEDGETEEITGKAGAAGEEGSADADVTVTEEFFGDGSMEAAGTEAEVSEEAAEEIPEETPEENGEEASLSAFASAVYVPGEGVIDTEGNVIAEEEEVLYVPGEGLYVDGELQFVESIFAPDDELSEEIREFAEIMKEAKLEASDKALDGTSRANGTAKVDGTHKSSGRKDDTGAEKKDGTGKSSGANGAVEEFNNGKGGSAGGTGADGAGRKAEDAYGGTRPVLLVSKAQKKQQAIQVAGKTVSGIDPVTGEVTEYDTESILDGRKVTVAEKKDIEKVKTVKKEKAEKDQKNFYEPPKKPEVPEQVVTISSFNAGQTFGIVLDSDEKNGFVLIGIIAVLTAGVLALIWAGVVRKRRTVPAKKRDEEVNKEDSEGEK